MSADIDARAAEVADKLAPLREALEQSTNGQAAGAIRLRGLDWFSWITAGGDASVRLAADCGAAEVLVTRDDAVILTDEAEAERLRQEQVPPGFTFHIAPWAEVELRETYVLGAAAGAGSSGIVLSDRPNHVDQPLPASLRLRRMVLGAGEQERYRALGAEAAAAVGDVLRAARPDWTEFQLAAAAAAALWSRGIQPAQVLAAGERRLPLYRHPAPSHERLGGRATLQVCARRHGLHANLARSLSFGPAPAEQAELLRVEATGLDAIRPGNSLAAVYHALDAAYRHANRPEAIRARQQGGITGYAAHEIVATASTATGLETGMALAFSPSLAGVTVEDTFLLGPAGLENLTLDPHWPMTAVPGLDAKGRSRPLWLENT